MPNPRPPAAPYSQQPLTRDRLRALVLQTLEPLAYVHALWEGGSEAFGRADAWSDLDLQACVDDDRVAATFAAVEAALEKAVGIEATFVVPEPAWHGFAQRFYRFRGQPPWLMLDLCVRRRRDPPTFLETEIHGRQPFLFDRIGLATVQQPLDPEKWEKQLRERVAFLRAKVGLFAHLVEKENRRRHPLDAFTFYHGMILLPLVELLRIRHDPWRPGFGLRYLHQVLPRGIARRVRDLCFLRHPDDLQAKCRVALRWFDELARELDRAPRLVFAPPGS